MGLTCNGGFMVKGHQQVKPNLIALVVCDNVYKEPDGKLALVGLFSRVYASTFPVVHARMVVFVSVTGLRKGSTGKVEIVNAETDQVVVSTGGDFPGDENPLAILDMTFFLRNIVFPSPGTYFINFWGNEQILASRPFFVGDATDLGTQL